MNAVSGQCPLQPDIHLSKGMDEGLVFRIDNGPGRPETEGLDRRPQGFRGKSSAAFPRRQQTSQLLVGTDIDEANRIAWIVAIGDHVCTQPLRPLLMPFDNNKIGISDARDRSIGAVVTDIGI